MVAHDYRHLGLVRGGQDPRRFFQLVRSHVAGWRVDEVAGQENAIGDAADMRGIGARRQGEAELPAGLLAIAGEGIAAKHKPDRRKVRPGRLDGEVPVTFR
ncbi:MAG: hypothetical protein E5V30_34350, partial [Mesorhizobium sp.]